MFIELSETARDGSTETGDPSQVLLRRCFALSRSKRNQSESTVFSNGLQGRLRRRLFRLLDEPRKPCLLIDAESLSPAEVLGLIEQFATSSDLRPTSNAVVALSTAHNRRSSNALAAQIHRLVSQANLFGSCVRIGLDHFDRDFPHLMAVVADQDGVVATAAMQSYKPADNLVRVEPLSWGDDLDGRSRSARSRKPDASRHPTRSSAAII